MVDYDFDKISIGVIDIQASAREWVPDPDQANEPITAIALKYIKLIMCLL
jgi:hypothetical protein